MGRKKKKNNLKNLLLTLLILIILIVLNHFGMIEKIDDLLAQTGLVEHFEEIKKSNTVTTGTVKNNTKIISSVSENIAIQQDKLNVIFFKVGQADCELIIANGKTMLIDAGNNNDGEKIVNAPLSSKKPLNLCIQGIISLSPLMYAKDWRINNFLFS